MIDMSNNNINRYPTAVRRVRLASGIDDEGYDEEKDNKNRNNNKSDDDSESDIKFIENSFRERALEEKCGVFGVISNGDWPTSLDVAQIICLGLVGLQHRGQESAGIVTCKYKTEPFNVSRSEGLVSSAFNEFSMMSLKGNLGIGHTRYSTTGGSGSIQLAQPFVVHTSYGTIAVAHNGELVNSSRLRETLLSSGVGLTTGGDSELITQCLSQTPPDEFIHPKILRRKQLQIQQQQQQEQQQQQQLNTSVKQESGLHQQQHQPNTSIKQESGLHQQQKQQINNNSTSTRSTSTSSTSSSSSSSGGDSSTSTPGEDKRTPGWKCDLTIEEDNITSRLLYLMSLTPISYSLLVMYNECLYATRDSYGNRPLAYGLLVPPSNAGDIGSIPFDIIENCFVEGWCISSESCPFPSVHARLKRDIEPGEIIKFERNKLPKTLAIMPRRQSSVSPAFCIFEYVYFARPDSIIEEQTVYEVRKLCGKRLAKESPAFGKLEDKSNFIVAPVPESSIPAALGYSEQSGIPYVEVFCKNRYVGRTFIQPSMRLRRLGVAKKFGPLTANFVGKSIILIDDSIVRGTTIAQLVRLLREAGAKEVHIRIASPPLKHPCYMGINIPTSEELIANHMKADQLAFTLGASSLKYLSIQGLRESVQSKIKKNILAASWRKALPPVEQTSIDETSTNNPAAIQNTSFKFSDNNLLQSTTSAPTNNYNNINGAGKVIIDNGDIIKPVFSDEEIRTKVGHCDACLTGNYPVKLDEDEKF